MAPRETVPVSTNGMMMTGVTTAAQREALTRAPPASMARSVSPDDVDALVKNPDNIRTPEQARSVLGALVPGATAENGSVEKYRAVTKSLEVLSPQSSAADVSRFLRREYYSDEMLDLGGYKISTREPVLSAEVAKMNLSPLRAWQEVPGRDGQKLDIAHTFVAVDAYASEPGLNGKAKAYLFTHVGDAATGALSAVGLKDAGNNNEVDQRGNAFGTKAVSRLSDNPTLPLSKLLR